MRASNAATAIVRALIAAIPDDRLRPPSRAEREEIDHLGDFAEQASCSEPPGMTTTSPEPQTRCLVPRRNSILPLSIQTICSFA
jgi:hypothetical protein